MHLQTLEVKILHITYISLLVSSSIDGARGPHQLVPLG